MDISSLLYHPTYNYDWLLEKPAIEKKHSEVDNEKIDNPVLLQKIIDFKELLVQNFNSEDLITFYNNINTLEIALNEKFLVYNDAYDPVNNKIYLEERQTMVPFWHELFHLSSTVYKKDVVFCGFSQWGKDFAIGIGLTEGYTQLLTDRYVINPDNFKHGYIDVVYFAKVIEMIVGTEKMNHLYLTSDLKGLVDELKKYSTKEEIMKFISKVDYVNACRLRNSKLNNIEKRIIHGFMIKSYREIKKFLLKTYMSKSLIEINEKSKENDHQAIMELIKVLNVNLDEVINEYNYIINNDTKKEIELLSKREIEKILAGSLGVQRRRKK